MTDIILRPNAVAVYTFLSHILARPEYEAGAKVLDCGAGGPLPPLAAFCRQGFDCFGIDIEEGQIEKAREFCGQNDITVDFRKGDVRRLPFEDGEFDYVYEQFAICHLSKEDTRLAIAEMRRVLKVGGLCLMGLISTDSWPILGKEDRPGEFVGKEHGQELVRHSFFSDEEADVIVADWKVIRKEKVSTWHVAHWRETSHEDWIKSHAENPSDITEAEWEAAFDTRHMRCRYVHTYYILEKPV